MISQSLFFDSKFNFNCHISAVTHKASVHASLILQTFVSGDVDILMTAFTTDMKSGGLNMIL